MILIRQEGDPPLQPGQLGFDDNPLRLRAHRSRWCAEIDQAIEDSLAGKQHWRDLLPALKRQRNEVVRVARAMLDRPMAPMRRFSLIELLATLGESDGLAEMALLLASPDGGTRRSAAIALSSRSSTEHFSRQQIREAIQDNDRARIGLMQMLFEADRWNRRIAIELCSATEIEIGDTLCRRLAAEPADPRGETAALIHYLASRKKDLGAIRLFEELAARRNRKTDGEPLPLHSLEPYLTDQRSLNHDCVLKLLIDFLAANRQPYLDDSWAEGSRYNEQANAVRTLVASPSEVATEELWRTARTEPHGYPRSQAWAALIRRQGLSACEAVLASSETADSLRDIFNAVFWDPPLDRAAALADLAHSLLAREPPDPVRKTLKRMVSRQRAREGTSAVAASSADEDRSDFDLLEPEAAAQRLVAIGALSASEAAAALACALPQRRADGYAPVLDNSRILCAFDVESPASPPWYEALLTDLSANSQGRLEVRCVRQLWYGQHSVEAFGVVQFICAETLVEFGVRDCGDYYDLPAVLRAVNAVVEQHQDARRFTPLGCGDQLCAVVFATTSAAAEVGKLIGLPVLTDADAPMLAGRRCEAAARG